MTETQVRAFAPGRVNLIGEHTDYNQGFALPFAIAQGVTVTAEPLSERIVRVTTIGSGQRDEFDPVQVEPRLGWRAFARGAIAELHSEGVDVRGTQITIESDLLSGAGLASSAALTLATVLALIAVSGHEELDRLTLAKLCQRVERDWAGANTGLLDPLASLNGEPEAATLIDFESLTTAQIPLDLRGHRIVLVDSGEHHNHATGQYNARRRECEEAANRMRLESLRDATITDLHMLPDELTPRARHVISEIGRTLTAVSTLRAGDFEKLGMLLNQSHDSLRDQFEVSTTATDALQAQLLDQGALGARLVGGGFGGSVLALFAPDTQLPEGATLVSPSAGARLL